MVIVFMKFSLGGAMVRHVPSSYTGMQRSASHVFPVGNHTSIPIKQSYSFTHPEFKATG